MTQNDLSNKYDIIFGSVIVPDHYDDPEIKKMWEDHFEFCEQLNKWHTREIRKINIKYGLSLFSGYAFIMANILFIGWYFR